eukprot:SAG22_NODE_83_length_21704_cov_58.556584_17_plen_51_part_00
MYPPGFLNGGSITLIVLRDWGGFVPDGGTDLKTAVIFNGLKNLVDSKKGG